MSAGKFTRSIYEANAGTFHRIRVQPETIIAGTNPAGAGPVTPGVPSARVSGGRRQLGLRARKVTIAWTGAAPDGYKPDGIISLPILTPAAFTALAPGSTFTYLGAEVQVLGLDPEVVK